MPDADPGPGVHVNSREHELWYVLEGDSRFLLVTRGSTSRRPRLRPPRHAHTFQTVVAAAGRLLVITGPSGLQESFLEYDRRATGPMDINGSGQLSVASSRHNASGTRVGA